MTGLSSQQDASTLFWTPVSIQAPEIPFPSNKRPFVGRGYFPVTSASTARPTVLRWSPAAAGPQGPCLLRLASVVDERVPHGVAVSNARTGALFGTMEVLFACPGQVFELPISADQAAEALADGLSLQLTEDTSPFWFSAAREGHDPVPAVMQPHLLFRGEAGDREDFLRLFCSPASLAPCDWMEACVLDGLRDWALLGRSEAGKALEDHLDAFFRADGRFIHENVRGEPNDERIGSAENTGPFAVLAMKRPEHRALSLVEADWDQRHEAALGGVFDGVVVAETSYSIAYPMMALAVHAGRGQWWDRAIQQLLVNRERLAGEDDLWLRNNPVSGERTFRNWSRGVAWYFLGLVRTLTLLPEAQWPVPLADEAKRMTAWVARHQQKSGLWPGYLKELEVAPDASGSAGMAAAVAIAVRHGLVDASWRPVAERAAVGLTDLLAPDGLLRGTAQSNKRESHGMDIQRHRFRVIAPWGAGLFAQLLAALQD